jgi:hypothetical protein
MNLVAPRWRPRFVPALPELERAREQPSEHEDARPVGQWVREYHRHVRRCACRDFGGAVGLAVAHDDDLQGRPARPRRGAGAGSNQYRASSCSGTTTDTCVRVLASRRFTMSFLT